MLKTSMVVAGIALALAVAASAAESDSRSELRARFSTSAPSAATGLSLRVFYKHPSDPAAKPPPLLSARFELPQGTRIDTGAVPACHATDEELRALGREACPAQSRVGDGTFTAVTGFGPPTDPVVADVTLYNGGDEIIELVTFKDSEAVAGYDRLKIRGHSLVVEKAPATPGGPPEGRTVPREIAVSFPVASPESAARSSIGRHRTEVPSSRLSPRRRRAPRVARG